MFGEEKRLRLLFCTTHLAQKSHLFINICANYSVVLIYMCVFFEKFLLQKRHCK